jgi:hypothetical protein
VKIVTERIRFDGASDRTAPMTWGQKAIYSSIRWLGEEAHYFNITRVVEAPVAVSVAEACDALAELFRRHEVLRTFFHETDDDWRQQVCADGTADVVVVHAEHDPAEAAADLGTELSGRSFCHDQELPIRLGLVLQEERVVRVVMVVSHLAVDGWAVKLLEQDVADLLARNEAAWPSWQPVDQASYESVGPGAERGEGALAYWRRALADVPRSLFPVVDEGGSADRFVRMGMDSRALAVAASILAGRCGVSTGTVLLAATATVLGQHVGHDRVALRLIAGNRLDARSRRYVGALSENALCVLDVGAAREEDGFAAVSRLAFGAGMLAYRHAQYDPVVLDEMLADERARNGGVLDLGHFFNDTRSGREWSIDHQEFTSADAVHELVELTEVSFVGSWERQDATYFVHVEEAAETCLLYLMADTRKVSSFDIARLLRAMEAVVVDAAAGGLPAR